MSTMIPPARPARAPHGSHVLECAVPANVMERLVRRECARADRTGGELSMVVFRVPASAARRRQPKSTRRLARTLLKRARLTDEVGWLGEVHLAALLPGTDADGARAFADGVCELVAKHAPRPLAAVYAYPNQWLAGGATRIAPMLQQREALRATGTDGHAGAIAHGNGQPRFNGTNLAITHANGHVHVERAARGPVASADRPIRTAARETEIATNASGPSVGAIEDLLTMPMPRWKRAIDVIGASMLLVALAPLMAIAALAIKATSPGPAVFRQRRAGLGGREFTICKFRTMVINAEQRQQELRKFSEQDGPAFKLTRDPRITRVGAFLRKTSIDELPQLWNVLKGDMSLVGPRPLPVAEQDAVEPWQRHRVHVTPGLTCIWQVKGRSRVTFTEWVRMDVEYIRRRTIFHDLSILLKTVPAVLLRRGAR